MEIQARNHNVQEQTLALQEQSNSGAAGGNSSKTEVGSYWSQLTTLLSVATAKVKLNTKEHNHTVYCAPSEYYPKELNTSPFYIAEYVTTEF